MKSLYLAQDEAAFIRLLSDTNKNKASMVVWQYITSENRRAIYQGVFNSVENDLKQITILTSDSRAFDFGPGPVYAYVHSKQYIFKAEQISVQNNFLTATMPFEIKFLSKEDSEKLKGVFRAIDPEFTKAFYADNANTRPDYYVGQVKGTGVAEEEAFVQTQSAADRAIFVSNLMQISMDEEDKQFSHKREAPRSRANSGKTVSLFFADTEDAPQSYSLFDLSRGGFAFLVKTANEFQKEKLLKIISFDTRRFDKPMMAKVMNIREADSNAKQFKVGCRFLSDNEILELEN